MSADPDDIVRDALVRMLSTQPRAVVTDALQLPRLVEAELGPDALVRDDLVRATLLGTRTPALRDLADDTPTDATQARLGDELRRLGVPADYADRAAAVWVDALAATSTVTVANPRPVGSGAAGVAGTAGVIGGAASPRSSGWPRGAKAVAGALAALALVAGVVAFAGWTRDPSKDRATTAEAEVSTLRDDLAKTEASLTETKGTVAQRDADLAAAKDQISKLSTITRSQVAAARLPATFTMSGKVAPGSCTLVGEACNVTPVVRAITLTCGTAAKPCDCTTGACSVTSELWKTASPVAYDASLGQYVAKGNLDGDVFRCGGLPQPTTYEFRLRVAKSALVDGVWNATALEADLAEASQATDCLAGNRTYALTGPTA